MFHFVGAKQTVFWAYPDWDLLPDTFFINRYGFYCDPNNPKTIKSLFRQGYRLQVSLKLRKKLKTATKLLIKFDIQKVFTEIVKYLK